MSRVCCIHPSTSTPKRNGCTAPAILHLKDSPMSKETESSEPSPGSDDRAQGDETSTTTTTNATEAKNDTPSIVKKEATKAEPPKKKFTDWPLKNIADPHDHDVLYGRGGGTNHHPGNKRYRKMVEDRKVDYVNSKRLDKPLVALEIIKVWRNQEPPGRFLKLDEKTGLWNDVGDKKAREKTSQVCICFRSCTTAWRRRRPCMTWSICKDFRF